MGRPDSPTTHMLRGDSAVTASGDIGSGRLWQELPFQNAANGCRDGANTSKTQTRRGPNTTVRR